MVHYADILKCDMFIPSFTTRQLCTFLSVCGTWIYCLLPALHAHLPCTTLLNSEECALSEKKKKKRQLQARDGWTDGQGATLNAHP